MNMFHIKEKLIQLGEEYDEREIQLSELLAELQSKCPHDPSGIIQTPWAQKFGWDEMELRLCSMCGLQDEGYNFKKHGVPYNRQNEMIKMSREEMYVIRRKITRGIFAATNEESIT